MNIIAHPTAILKRYKIRLPYWMKAKIAREAKKENKIFEINKKFKVPDKTFLKILKDQKVNFVDGSDSHNVGELKQYDG